MVRNDDTESINAVSKWFSERYNTIAFSFNIALMAIFTFILLIGLPVWGAIGIAYGLLVIIIGIFAKNKTVNIILVCCYVLVFFAKNSDDYLRR